MDPLILSRIQFALNIGFHFLYPPISIGLGLMLVIMEGLYLKTKDLKYREMTSFWIKIFALVFAVGVATGLVQSFSFGTNWARFSRFAGDVFGSALAAEGVFAFFLESGFLGILLFGWDRVGPKLHYFSTICVALGSHFSAIWILVANSWMQTPAGSHIEMSPTGPRAVVTDFWAMVFNPSAVDRICHVILACWLAGAFFVISVAAYYLLRKRHLPIARPMMKIGLIVASFTLVLQLISGDSSAKLVAKYQPAKLAAFEGVYDTVPSTPISVIGWVDTKNETVHSLKIPGALSFLTYGNFTQPVTGLHDIPRDEWPNVAAVFQFYHLMVTMWGLMALLAALAAWHWRKKTLENKTWLLWCLIVSVGLPQIALQAGWFATEMGRQPWLVWHIFRTSEGVSAHLQSGQIIGSILMFISIYGLLLALFLFLLNHKIQHGPEDVKPDEKVYSNPWT